MKAMQFKYQVVTDNGTEVFNKPSDAFKFYFSIKGRKELIRPTYNL